MSIYIKPLIQFVSAECGRGKTYATCKVISETIAERNHLYVAPTIKLLEQTKQELTKFGIAADSIHSDNTDAPIASILDYLRKANRQGHVLLITWAAYSSLPYFHSRESWNIYIDELPQLDHYYKPMVPYNKEFILEHIEIDRSINETIGVVKAINPNRLKYHLKHKAMKDDVYRLFYDLLNDVAGINKDVFVDLASWDKIFERVQIDSEPEGNQVYFLSAFNPYLFKGTTLLGANIEESMLYDWLSRYHHCLFVENKAIASNLREKTILGSRVKVSYFLKDKNWSKSIRNKSLKNGNNNSVMDAVEKGVEKLIGNDPFLLVANNDYKGGLSVLPNATRIAVDSKGMNAYQDFTRIVHLPALNREPKHCAMLTNLGFSPETIRISTGYEVLYQNLMRTALRNPESKDIVEVITGSEFEANFLIRVLGEGVQKRRVGDFEFKAYKPLTQVQKNLSFKAQQIKEELTQLGLSEEASSPLFSYFLCLYNKNSNINPAKRLNGIEGDQSTSNAKEPSKLPDFLVESRNDPFIDPGYSLTLNKSIYDSNPDAFKVARAESFMEFVKVMRTLSKETIKDKSERFLLNPIIYKMDESGLLRKKDNFQEASMMVLDFDGGNFSPEDFVRIFWDEAGTGQKRSFLICNSFSRDRDNPNRFRAFLPYIKPAKSLEEHQAVYHSIVKRLEKNGFTEESAKLDRSAINGTQPFYAPATNRNYPEGHLFIAKGTQKREINRYAINPETYLKTTMKRVEKEKVVELAPETTKRESKGIDVEEKIAEIKFDYQSVPIGAGLRNSAFFRARARLSRYISPYEVKSVLIELAGNDRKMIGRVEGVMKSLRRG